MNRIVTATDVARRDGFQTAREWMRAISMELKQKGGCPAVFSGNMGQGRVYAYISNSRWMAVCDEPGCAGCEYVDPADPIFYCLTCGNSGSGNGKQVIFPQNYKDIEAALLERVMVPAGGTDVVTQVFNARPLESELRRDWMPEELSEIHWKHPALYKRVLVEGYSETAEQIRALTKGIMEGEHARNV
jgi:hypothetical protein